MYSYLINIVFATILLVAISCNETSEKGQVSIEQDTTVVNNIQSDSTQFELLFKQILNKENTTILSVTLSGDTLELVSDGDLSWRPFGIDTKLDKINKKFSFLRKYDTSFIEKGHGINGVLLKSHLSSIFFREPTKGEIQINTSDSERSDLKLNQLRLYRATVKDSIQLAYGVTIGMKKADFFSRILGVYNEKLLEKINVVVNSDPPGEVLDVYFLFSGVKLDEVRMQAPY